MKINIVPVQIVEQGVGKSSFPEGIAFKAVSVNTHIEVGENKITASIDAIFIYTE